EPDPTQPKVQLWLLLPVGQLDRRLEMASRLYRCRSSPGHVGGTAEPGHGTATLGLVNRLADELGKSDRLAEVVRDELSHGVGVRSGRDLQPRPRRRVEPDSGGTGECSVRDLPDEDVAEREQVSPRGSDEIPREQLVRGIGAGDREVRIKLNDSGQPVRATEDRADLQHASG